MENAEKTIADRVKNIIVEHLCVPAEKVTPGALFVENLGADSLDVVELVMGFEGEFSIYISDDEAEKISSVQEAVDLIKEKLEK